MRTYRADDYHRAVEAWRDFGPEWAEIRQIANNWSVFPPSGSKWDSWDEPHPSQRAILWRALDYQPDELKRIVRESRSWSQVVDRVIGMFGRLRAEADDTDRDTAWDKEQHPDHRQSVLSLGEIMKRIGDSV